MGVLDVGGLWCPECGAEYRAGFVECSDCRVPLSSQAPPPRPKRPIDTTDHGDLVYDLAAWTEDQRGALDLMLIGAEVPHVWEGNALAVPHRREADADELIESVEEGELAEDWAAEATEFVDLDDTAHPELASGARRLLGYVVDVVVITAFSAVIGRGILDLQSSSPIAVRLVLPALIAAYEIATVARWGHNLGKVAAGTLVVTRADGSMPGWRRATVRWAVHVGPAPVLFWVSGSPAAMITIAILENVWLVAVYAGVWWNPQKQGLHDKAAGTIVVEA
jgi:uncharacterized RDD family membrane protein YckC